MLVGAGGVRACPGRAGARVPGRQLLDPFSSLCACAFLETYPCWHRHGNRQCDAQAPYAIAGARPLFIRRSIDATRCKLTPPQFSLLWTGLQEQLARRVCCMNVSVFRTCTWVRDQGHTGGETDSRSRQLQLEFGYLHRRSWLSSC